MYKICKITLSKGILGKPELGIQKTRLQRHGEKRIEKCIYTTVKKEKCIKIRTEFAFYAYGKKYYMEKGGKIIIYPDGKYDIILN